MVKFRYQITTEFQKTMGKGPMKGEEMPIPKRMIPPPPPAPREIPPAPTLQPEGSDYLGRIDIEDGLLAYICVCGCGESVLEQDAVVPPFKIMENRNDGFRIYAADLWRHAFNPNHIGDRLRFSLLETRRMAGERENLEIRLEREAEARERARIEAEARNAPRPHMRMGKTARDRANKAMRRRD